MCLMFLMCVFSYCSLYPSVPKDPKMAVKADVLPGGYKIPAKVRFHVGMSWCAGDEGAGNSRQV